MGLPVIAPVEAIVGERGLDYLLNNAAMVRPSEQSLVFLMHAHLNLWVQNIRNDSPFDFKPADLMTTVQLNVTGPAHLAQTLQACSRTGARKP